MTTIEALEISEDLLISLQNHLERAVEDVDKIRTHKPESCVNKN